MIQFFVPVFKKKYYQNSTFYVKKIQQIHIFLLTYIHFTNNLCWNIIRCIIIWFFCTLLNEVFEFRLICLTYPDLNVMLKCFTYMKKTDFLIIIISLVLANLSSKICIKLLLFFLGLWRNQCLQLDSCQTKHFVLLFYSLLLGRC